MTRKIEKVTVEGVGLLVAVDTIQCRDGVTLNIADPFVQVLQDGCRIALALSAYRVSDQGIADAIQVAQMPNRCGDTAPQHAR